MASYPPPTNSSFSTFNSTLYQQNSDPLSIGEATSTFLKLSGGTISGDLTTNGKLKTNPTLQILDSTDTSRMISCLDATNNKKAITVGVANNSGNQGEITFNYTSSGSSSNNMSLGLHSNQIMYICNNGCVGIKDSTPSQALSVTGIVDSTLGYKANGIDAINNAACFVGTGGMSTSGRITTSHTSGFSNFGTFSSEGVFSVSGSGAFIGSYSSHPTRIGVNNTTIMYFGSNKTGCSLYGTRTDFPLSIETNTGLNYPIPDACRYYNDQGSVGVSSNCPSISLYANGRLLCRGELDVISDKRTKENIKTLDEQECLRFVNEVETVKFNYKKEGSISYGYIAQDVLKKKFNDLITFHNDEEMEELIDNDGFISKQGVRFGIITNSVVPILHNVVKQLVKENDEMKEQIKIILDKLNSYTNI